jgi:hypothetical protein
VIDDYLKELAHELGLRTPHTRRILLEVEDHLREAARELGEEEAVARFGRPREVAAGFAREAGARMTRWSAWAAGAAVLAMLAAYGIVENSLPPAPWPSADAAPDYLRWKLEAAVWLIGGGFLAGGAALAVALVRPLRVRLALATAGAALLALGAAGVLGVVEGFQRAAVYRELGVEGALPDLAIAAVSAMQLSPVLAGLAIGARAIAWLRLA